MGVRQYVYFYLLDCRAFPLDLYTNELKSWVLAAPDIRIFEAASIVQLIQV